MADNIGTAYVQIEPSFEGVTPKIEQHFGGEGEKASKSFGNGFASVAGTVGKVMAGAAAAGATAVAGLTKQAVSSFAEFEQLQGGAELLFGDAYGKVITNANHAFSEVQMSINDYLQTANGYATGLKQALGGDEMAAADLADRIITAQADVVAATGASQESIANAFSGIMKNNFTMLDNLQLGIKPTKEGMQEVINKMNEWNASQGKTTKYQMGNLADMQSAIVDYVAYVGMAGYAHEEGAKTIQGSLAQAKASWDNLLTALGTGDSDFISDAIDNLVNSAKTFGANLMPVIQDALKGIANLIQELAPMITAELPGLVTSILPPVIDAAVQIMDALAKGLTDALPVVLNTVAAELPMIIDTFMTILPQILEVGLDLIMELAKGIVQALPSLMPKIVDIILQVTDWLLDNIDMVIDVGIELIMVLAEGILEALPTLVGRMPEIIIKLAAALIRALPKILQAGVELILMFIKGIFDQQNALMKAGIDIVNKVKEGFSGYVQQAKNWGKDMIQNFIDGILAKWNDLKASVSKVASTVKSYLGFSEPDEGPLSNFHTYAPDMMKLFAQGITENSAIVKSALTDATSGLMTSGVDANSVKAFQTTNSSIMQGNGDDGYGRIATLLEGFIENFKQDIYLDTGALVGGTVAAYNTALGRIAVRGSGR